VKLTNSCKKIRKTRGVTWGNNTNRFPSSVKASQPLVRATRKAILTDQKGLRGQYSARSDLCEGRHSWIKSTPQTSLGCGNFVLASPHTALSETSVRALQDDAERASSVGICLAN